MPDDVSGIFGAFPSPECVTLAASMFSPHRVEDRNLGVTLVDSYTWDRSLRVANAKSRELWPDAFARQSGVEWSEMVEGPRWRVMISPGTMAVRSSCPARAERAHERQVRYEQGVDGDKVRPESTTGQAVIAAWSAKSRARMVEVMQSLDWSELFATEAVPALVTLTYPGDWLAVAPHSRAVYVHLRLLGKRFARGWGTPLVGVWKREFQRRGAPHFHLLMVPPHGQVNGQAFPEWLSTTWANIVGAERCGELVCSAGERCEYHAHVLAGTGIDYAKGVRCRDPRSIGVYFSKHGSFAGKDEQNHPPPEWTSQEGLGVGRYWGVWGLRRSVAGVFIEPCEAQATMRTLKRYSRANAPLVDVPMWRYRERVDSGTGEVSAIWRKSRKRRRLYRLGGGQVAGFLAVKDAPRLATQVARHLDQLRRPQQVIGAAGGRPVGFLP